MKRVHAVGQALCHDIAQIIPEGLNGARLRKEYIVQPERFWVYLQTGPASEAFESVDFTAL